MDFKLFKPSKTAALRLERSNLVLKLMDLGSIQRGRRIR